MIKQNITFGVVRKQPMEVRTFISEYLYFYFSDFVYISESISYGEARLNIFIKSERFSYMNLQECERIDLLKAQAIAELLRKFGIAVYIDGRWRGKVVW